MIDVVDIECLVIEDGTIMSITPIAVIIVVAATTCTVDGIVSSDAGADEIPRRLRHQSGVMATVISRAAGGSRRTVSRFHALIDHIIFCDSAILGAPGMLIMAVVVLLFGFGRYLRIILFQGSSCDRESA